RAGDSEDLLNSSSESMATIPFYWWQHFTGSLASVPRLIGQVGPSSGAGRCRSTRLLLGRPLGEATLSAIPRLQVGGVQTGGLGDSGKDARAQFLVVMKGEHEVRPIRPRACGASPIDA